MSDVRRWGLLLAALVLVACRTDSGDDDMVTGTGCVPGQPMSCVGPGGCAGSMLCELGGESYAACTCPGAPDATVPDASGVDASVEASLEAGVEVDASDAASETDADETGD